LEKGITMKRCTRIVTLPLTLALALVASNAWAQPAQSETFRIGLLAPTTGFGAAMGQMMTEGAILALEQYEYTVNGHAIDFFIEDTRMNGEIAVDKSRKLNEEDRVHVIVGPLSGGVGLSVLDWARDSGVPVVMAYSAPEDITMRLRVDNVVRNSWTGSQPMDPFGYWVATELGYKRIYMVGEDYSYPYNQIGGFKRGFCRGGGELVTTVWHPVPTEDFSSFLARIPRTGYDAVLYNGAGSNAVAFVNQYIEFGMLDVYPLLGQSNTFEQGDLPAMLPEAAGGLSAIQYLETLETPEFTAFAEAFRNRWGRLPSASAEHAYTGIVMALRAVEAIDDFDDRPALIEALRATDYPDAPRGGFYLDEYANPVHNIYIREVREVDGQLMNFGIVRVPEVSQFGPYDPDLYMAQPIDARDYPPDACADFPPEMLDVDEVYEFIPMGGDR
jgi:branched-chain amino acid transport system substrate-binding protein